MAEDKKEPDISPPGQSGTSEPSGATETPRPDVIPPGGGVAASADDEKASLVEQAKTRVAAIKESLTQKEAQKEGQDAATQPPAATKGPPKPPVKKKDEGPKPTDASNHPIVLKLKAQFSDTVIEAVEFLGQLSIRIVPPRVVAVCEFLKRDEQTPFDYLSDLTAVHFPLRSEAPLEIIYNLYSIRANARVRLKVALPEAAGVESVTSVWPAANWMEREVYDLFGVTFMNHPDLRRLLLPPDWEGYPLRKDYPLEFVENAWTKQHLPEMNEVQLEQLQQRRAYGLEILSVPQERMMRDILQGGKEVMPKDK